MSIIEDGTGKGNKVKVNSKNQLATVSVTVSELTTISSTEGGTHNYHFSKVLTAAATDENLAFFEYTGDFQLQIDSIRFGREDVALANSGQAVFTVYKDVLYTSGGAAVNDFNINLGSSKEADVIAYAGSTTLVLDTTNQFKLEDVIVSDFESVDYKGALILQKGDSIAVKAKSKNISDKMHLSIFAFEVKEVI